MRPHIPPASMLALARRARRIDHVAEVLIGMALLTCLLRWLA